MANKKLDFAGVASYFTPGVITAGSALVVAIIGLITALAATKVVTVVVAKALAEKEIEKK